MEYLFYKSLYNHRRKCRHIGRCKKSLLKFNIIPILIHFVIKDRFGYQSPEIIFPNFFRNRSILFRSTAADN